MAPKSQITNRKSQMLRPLYAEWRKFLEARPNPTNLDERGWRIQWTNDLLLERHQRLVRSWKDLTAGQARLVLKTLREESGDGPRYRAMRIAKLACELWGGQAWDDRLRTRLGERFHVRDPRELTPAEAKAMMEELQSCIARRDGVPIEEVRARFKGKG